MSSLEQHLTGYLAVRRAMGYKLARAGKLLPQFTTWMAERDQSLITSELALEVGDLPAGDRLELASPATVGRPWLRRPFARDRPRARDTAS